MKNGPDLTSSLAGIVRERLFLNSHHHVAKLMSTVVQQISLALTAGTSCVLPSDRRLLQWCCLGMMSTSHDTVLSTEQSSD